MGPRYLWGEVLSTVLPGSVAVFALAPYFPLFWALIEDINNIGLASGVMLLFASTVAGGVLEGLTRIGWEKVLTHLCPSPKGVLLKLTPQNLELYERAVQGSYKYVNFYSHLALAVLLLLVMRWNRIGFSWLILLLTGVIAALLYASYVQWTYFVNYQQRVFIDQNAFAEKDGQP